MVNDNGPDVFDPERRQGFLNERYRRYLTGQADIEPQTQQERDIRAAVRRRLYQAILDFSIVQRYLSSRDLDLIADHLSAGEEIADHSMMRGPRGIHRGAVDALTVLARLHPDLEAVEGSVGEAGAYVLRENRGGAWSVNVDIDAERTRSPEEIQQKVNEGDIDDLSGSEAKQALSMMAGE